MRIFINFELVVSKYKLLKINRLKVNLFIDDRIIYYISLHFVFYNNLTCMQIFNYAVSVININYY